MIKLEAKFKPILLESLEDMMYKVSLQLEEFKGQPLDQKRTDLTQKQLLIEELQHIISENDK